MEKRVFKTYKNPVMPYGKAYIQNIVLHGYGNNVFINIIKMCITILEFFGVVHNVHVLIFQVHNMISIIPMLVL